MRRVFPIILVIPAALVAQAEKTPAAKQEFFETRIRPVIAPQCFACHTGSAMGGLQMDSRAALLKGGKSGPAIVPGDPDKSLLISAIRQTGGLKMPKGGRLTDAEIADFSIWVKDGAFWPGEIQPDAVIADYKITERQRNFWSYQPLKSAAVPIVKNEKWPKTDIDRFILARLEKDGVRPGVTADRRILIRRLSFDLTGLPPTVEEVQAFEADKSPGAYEKLVDRLLASPHYGELWGRHWLDVVRYAEDDYRLTKKPDRIESYPFAYTYRDWVIRALNDDMSYGLFVKAQLAADLLDEPARQKSLPALGMNGLGVWQFVDNPPAVERADEWHDKLDVTTKAFLGLTVGCARCHNHKYDPIPAQDYYRIAGMFASSNFKAYPLAPKAEVDEYDKQKVQLEQKEKALKSFVDRAAELSAQALLEESEEYMMAAWRVARQKKTTAGAVADESHLDSEILQRWIHFLEKKPTNYSYLEGWQKMIAGGGGSEEEARKLARTFHQTAVEIDTLHAKLKEDNQIELDKLKDPDEKTDALPNGLKRKLNPHQIALKGLNREQTYLWRDLFDQDLPEAPDTPDATNGLPPPGLFKLTDWALEKRLGTVYASHIARQRAENEAFKKTMPKPYPFVYGLEDAKEPVDLRVFLRGSPYSLGETAPRAFLSILSQGEPKPFGKGSGRLEFAEDVIQSPIAARVIVNRIWRWNMGTGLTETPSNLGLLGERPSNPELLDYLASKFVAEGMSWKKLTKEIVMSRVYQLSSEAVGENSVSDPNNRLYWRANRRRLEAEGIWDALLSASGKLDLGKVGGPSEDLVEGMNRRGMYGKVSRVFPNAFQVSFDFPTSTLSAERRYITNVPQQRLFFLNNPFPQAQARALAERVREAGSGEAQVRKAFALVYQRQPTAQELSLGVEFLRESANASPLAAKPAPVGGGVTANKDASAELSRLQFFCWALLSSNEFLFID